MASNPHFGSTHDGDHPDREDEWAQMRTKYLKPKAERAASSARGVHHQALISSDVERTIGFYQDLLEFPLTELFENRDYEGSTHFFFDIGNGNALAFSTFPGWASRTTPKCSVAIIHLAISVPPDNWTRLKGKLEGAGVDTSSSATRRSISGPDGERLELINDPLGEMYGNAVL